MKLPSLLLQFREALSDEIEVAKRRSILNAIPLTNGIKLSQKAGGFQYSFIIDSILNIPDGAPGSLIIQGRPPIDVSIIAYEGLKLLLNIPLDIGPFVPHATLQSDLSMLMKKLIERIEAIGEKPNPAGDRILGLSEPRIALPKNVDRGNLNDEQYKALLYSLGSETTFIWGPPGTGKTHTIGAIAKELYRTSRSLLLVSHTNNAVDQALDNIASHLKSEISKGLIIRVGQPKAFKYPEEIILKNQVELRSKALTDTRNNYVDEKDRLVAICIDLQKKISICDWLENARPDIDLIGQEVFSLREQERERNRLEAAFLSIQQELPEAHRDLSHAKECLESRITRSALSRRIDELRQTIRANKMIFTSTIGDVSNLCCVLQLLEKITPIRYELSTLPRIQEQESAVNTTMVQIESFETQLREKNNCLSDAKKALDETLRTGALMRMWKRLPKPETQKNIVDAYKNDVDHLNHSIAAKIQELTRERAMLQRIIDLTRHIDPYRHLKSIVDTDDDLKEKNKTVNRLKAAIRDDISEVKSSLVRLVSIEKNTDIFCRTYNRSPDEVMHDAEEKISLNERLEQEYTHIRDCCNISREKIQKDLSHKLNCVRSWGLSDSDISTAENMYASLTEAYSKALLEYSGLDIEQLKDQYAKHNDEIARFNRLIAEIDERLKDVEKEIVSKALIVVSTLTKAYRDDNIQGRSFDTVVLDEASMAPIPALWVSASLAKASIVIIGDFKQLPPIVLSEKKETREWLGRDIFDKSGMIDKYRKKETPEYFVALKEQKRLPPQICSISNGLFYHDLVTKPDFKLNDISLWYDEAWGYHKNYVLLVDTGSIKAWVTSVTRGGSTSRLNFLSATICLDIAGRLLKKGRPARNDESEPHRIFIISPYRAHSKLLKIMINEENLSNDVSADTVHGFQGREAEIVIFDLVVDQPHFKVNLFMPQNDEALKRLYNVALTRAKNRLIIVGNFQYCLKLGKKAFLGANVIPFLINRAKFRMVEARDLVPAGVMSRAATSSFLVAGGKIEPPGDRSVMTQEAFYRLFFDDIKTARKRIVIYSPFIASDRLSLLEVYLRSAIENKVGVYVITKAFRERPAHELAAYRKNEAHLKEMGAHIIHKLRMHEKLVFIDDNILWSGSLNTLSYSNTQEVMERRDNAKVFDDYATALRMEDLVGIINTSGESCPICNGEMIAVEGADDPYYWECIKGRNCYSRSIDRPHPVDGVFLCHKCSAPYKYHFTNNKPIWRCTSNNRHHMKMFASHLKLPKMLALIPKNELKTVCKFFAISKDVVIMTNAQLPFN